MISTKDFLEKLCVKYNVSDYTVNEMPVEAFIEWYNKNKDKSIDGIQLSQFDLQSVINIFDEELQTLY